MLIFHNYNIAKFPSAKANMNLKVIKFFSVLYTLN